jgi:hypothetical protein
MDKKKVIDELNDGSDKLLREIEEEKEYEKLKQKADDETLSPEERLAAKEKLYNLNE